MNVKHARTLVENVHQGTMEPELHDAITYVQPIITQRDWMVAVGIAAATTTPKEVMKKMRGKARRLRETAIRDCRSGTFCF